MPRTTLNIEGPVWSELRALQAREGRPLGRVVSTLLAEALASRRAPAPEPTPLRWTARSMGARVDLTDAEALYAALDADHK